MSREFGVMPATEDAIHYGVIGSCSFLAKLRGFNMSLREATRQRCSSKGVKEQSIRKTGNV